MTTTTTKKTSTRKPAAKKTTSAPVKLPANPFVSEVLDLVTKQRTREKQIEVLKEYESDSLKAILIWNFDESAISVLPEGPVPFKPNDAPAGTTHSSLRREYKYLYNFLKGGNDTLSPLRRETMFIQILENLHPEEAEILCLVKDKKLQSKYKITKELVSEAYPDIVWGGRS